MSTPIAPDSAPERGSLLDPSEEEIKLYRAMPYKEFLKTDYWAIVRDDLIATVGKCQLCSARNGLRCHHNSYEHHGSEQLHPEDLTVLCDRCHMYFHRTERLGASFRHSTRVRRSTTSRYRARIIPSLEGS